VTNQTSALSAAAIATRGPMPKRNRDNGGDAGMDPEFRVIVTGSWGIEGSKI